MKTLSCVRKHLQKVVCFILSVMPLLSLSPLNILTHENSILCQETSSESGLLYTFIYSRE